MAPETVTITVTTPAQKLAVQTALSMVQEIEAAAQAASPSKVLDACETVAFHQGRQFLADTLQSVIQQQIDDSQKKTAPHANAPAVKLANPKARVRSR